MNQIYDLTPEDLVIKNFFEDNTLQHRIAQHLEPILFYDDSNQKICDWIIRFHKAYNRYPGAQELVAAVPPCAQRTKLINICNNQIQPMERNFVVDQIEKFFKERKTQAVLTDAAEAIHQRDFSNISDIVKNLQDSINFNLSLDIGLDVVEDVQEALDRLNESMRAIPSGFADIRAYTSNSNGFGGHYRKALSIFLGQPNVGKSIVLCSEAAFAYQKGYNVLYVTLEMAEELIWERIASNITNIPMSDIRVQNEAQMQELLKRVPDDETHSVGKLVVKSMPTTSTVVDIENEIIEIKRTKGFDIDMLVVDYIGIMKPAKRASSMTNHSLYTMGKEIAEQLRDLAKSRIIAVVTASQLNRDGYGNKAASMQNVAGSAGLNDTADFMMSITQDALLKSFGMFQHNIMKNRFGPNEVPTLSKCSYANMRVRSATTQEIQEYSAAQISQDGDADSFTPRSDDLRGSDKAPSKSREEIEAQRKQMEELRENVSNKQSETEVKVEDKVEETVIPVEDVPVENEVIYSPSEETILNSIDDEEPAPF